MKRVLFLVFISSLATNFFGQKPIYEKIDYLAVQTPNQPLDASIKTYKVYVETEYTLTEAEVEAQSQADFEKEQADYAETVKQSELDHEARLKKHQEDVAEAEARYEKEMEDFKSLTILERLALTDQGKQPKLVLPREPNYIKPREPQYKKPRLNDYLLFDNTVLADGIVLSGYEKKEGGDVNFIIKLSKMAFQANAGQTFYNQTANLKIMQGTQLLHEKTFDDGFQFLTASPTTPTYLVHHERKYVVALMDKINDYINAEFGYVSIPTSIRIGYVKNKKRLYDALENAKIKAMSAYRKMTETATVETRGHAKEELLASCATWQEELGKVDYSDKKAVLNANVAKMLFFNLLRVELSLKDKAAAEHTLKAFQERRIDLNLNNNEKKLFTELEEQVYKL